MTYEDPHPIAVAQRLQSPSPFQGQVHRGGRANKYQRYRAVITFIAIAALLTAAPPQAQAQDYPSKPITLIVPFTPGGSTSVIARAIADKLSEQLKQPIVIENRGGAGTTIGA